MWGTRLRGKAREIREPSEKSSQSGNRYLGPGKGNVEATSTPSTLVAGVVEERGSPASNHALGDGEVVPGAAWLVLGRRLDGCLTGGDGVLGRGQPTESRILFERIKSGGTLCPGWPLCREGDRRSGRQTRCSRGLEFVHLLLLRADDLVELIYFPSCVGSRCGQPTRSRQRISVLA